VAATTRLNAHVAVLERELKVAVTLGQHAVARAEDAGARADVASTRVRRLEGDPEAE